MKNNQVCVKSVILGDVGYDHPFWWETKAAISIFPKPIDFIDKNLNFTLQYSWFTADPQHLPQVNVN